MKYLLLVIFLLLSFSVYSAENLFEIIKTKTDKEILVELQKEETDLTVKDNDGNNLLAEASYYLREASVHYLLEKGLKPEEKNNKGESSYYRAVFNDQDKKNYKVDFTASEDKNDKLENKILKSVLSSALKSSEKSFSKLNERESKGRMVRILVDILTRGKGIYEDTANRESILKKIVGTNSNTEGITESMNTEDIEFTGEYLINNELALTGKNAFFYALTAMDIKILEYIYTRSKIDFNEEKYKDVTHFLYKSISLDTGESKDDFTLKMLIGNLDNYNGKKLLWLIDKGYNINQKDSNGCTMLFYSIISKNKSSFEELMKRGAEIEIIDKQGRTPIFYALMVNDTSFIKSLIEKNAKLDVKDINGDNPLDFYNKNFFDDYKNNFIFKAIVLKYDKSYFETVKLLKSKGVVTEKSYDKNMYYKDIIFFIVIIVFLIVIIGLTIFLCSQVKKDVILLRGLIIVAAVFLFFIGSGVITYQYVQILLKSKVKETGIKYFSLSPMCDIKDFKIRGSYLEIRADKSIIIKPDFIKMDKNDFYELAKQKNADELLRIVKKGSDLTGIYVSLDSEYCVIEYKNGKYYLGEF